MHVLDKKERKRKKRKKKDMQCMVIKLQILKSNFWSSLVKEESASSPFIRSLLLILVLCGGITFVLIKCNLFCLCLFICFLYVVVDIF